MHRWQGKLVTLVTVVTQFLLGNKCKINKDSQKTNQSRKFPELRERKTAFKDWLHCPMCLCTLWSPALFSPHSAVYGSLSML